MRVISKEELDTILSAHMEWLEDSATGSRADLSNVDLKYADLTEANLNYSDLSNANLFGANLADASLFTADLVNANLSYANLTNANLNSALLVGANLTYANLRHADLTNATLGSAKIMVFQFNRHIAYCTGNGSIRIGCEYLSIEDWKNKYKEIGEQYCYTDLEIEMYGRFISMCEELRK